MNFIQNLSFKLKLLLIAIPPLLVVIFYSIIFIFNLLDEKSNLKIRRVIFEFPYKHNRNLLKRIAYSYYIREFNLASLELPIGLLLGGFGLIRGATAWWHSLQTGITAPAGTVVLSAVLVLSSIQFMLGFLNFDINNYPKNLK